MARLHFVKKARKAHKDIGVKKGESYYWAAFRSGRSSFKRKWKNKPRRSQLTQSDFLGALYDIEDDLHEADKDGIAEAIETAVGALRDLADETQSKYDNMPEGLQSGDTGQLLEERVNKCNEIADELEGIDVDVEDGHGDDVLDTVQQVCFDVD